MDLALSEKVAVVDGNAETARPLSVVTSMKKHDRMRHREPAVLVVPCVPEFMIALNFSIVSVALASTKSVLRFTQVAAALRSSMICRTSISDLVCDAAASARL
jgi:hypothetical protein